MSMDNKAAASQNAQATQFATEATDEIAEIMNEIQSLQQSMAQAQAPRAPVAAVAAAPAPIPAAEADSGLLEEFEPTAGEASMEETLGGLTPEKEESKGPSLLEEALAADEEAQVKEAHTALEDHHNEVESLIEAEMAAEAGRAVAGNSDVQYDESTEAALDALDGVSPMDAAGDEPFEEEFSPPVRSSRKAPSKPSPVSEVESSPSAGGASDGALTMTLTGNMTLRLKYEFGGQEVSVKFEDHFLQLTLADGTEFKVPVGRKALKAA